MCSVNAGLHALPGNERAKVRVLSGGAASPDPDHFRTGMAGSTAVLVLDDFHFSCNHRGAWLPSTAHH
jgi:hypothetical protein